ncbi:uncharacterized protein LOC100198078 isoform X1 [Hydra vulgaris]|uniref:uncharacterized protein LOC100198078 isoform X1 n=1 Tax=Hydra vulgaris TaxID=6087 RepID=UPI0002B4621D|nr:uncharacterized protein LOC100198078 [Hydra vulgaris]
MFKVVWMCVFASLASAFRLPFTNINVMESLPGIMPFNWNKISPWYSMRTPSTNYHSEGYTFGEPTFEQPNFDISEDAFQMPDYSFSWNMPNFPQFDAKDKNTKTKNKTYEKDGYKITEIKKFGPGWTSYISEAVKEIKTNKTGNETSKFKSFNFGGDLIDLFGAKAKKFFEQRKCKKCPPNKFCDPLSGKCKKQLKAGSDCAFAEQCKSPLLCVWGKCNLATQGDAGTFCNRSEYCSGDSRCVPYTDNNKVCVPALGEGSICGEKYEGFGFFLASSTKKLESDENPCKRGLKCADVGDPENKRCVQMSFKESADESDKSAKQIQAEQENPLVIKKVNEKKNKDKEGSGDESDDTIKDSKKEVKKLKSFPDKSDQEPNEPNSKNPENSIKDTSNDTSDPIKQANKGKEKKRKRKNSQKLSPSVLRK